MMSWAAVVFRMQDEEKIIALKAHSCVSRMKDTYKTVGRLYGYLSKFAHWGHVIHGHFLSFKEEHVGILMASVRFRAVTLALCLVILDVFVEVVRFLYAEKSDALVLRVQGVLSRDEMRKTHQYLSKIADLSGLHELKEIQSLLQ